MRCPQAVELVRHRIHFGGFQAYALRFFSVLGSAEAGIHRGKLGGGLKSTVYKSRGWSLRTVRSRARALEREHALSVILSRLAKDLGCGQLEPCMTGRKHRESDR